MGHGVHTLCIPERKPMATARRVSLFHREIRVQLSAAAVDILFELASVLSEGQIEDGGYYGSTMITFDLGRAAHLVSDPCDASSARKLCDLVTADARVRERARELGRAEGERIAAVALGDAQIDVRARQTGVHLHLDVDVEATIPSCARAM